MLHKITVIEIFTDQDAGDGERQRAVCPRIGLQVQIRRRGSGGDPRIDDDDLSAALLDGADLIQAAVPGICRVARPDYKGFAMCGVGARIAAVDQIPCHGMGAVAAAGF